MNVYTITGFSGHFPVGTAAVVVARDRRQALRALNEELIADGLPPVEDGSQLVKIDLLEQAARILCNGDY